MNHSDPWNPDHLRQMLNKSRVPKQLVDRLHADVDQYADAGRRQGQWKVGAFAVAATALIISVLVPLMPHRHALPSAEFVIHALSHANEEARLNGVLDGEFKQWRAQTGITVPNNGVELQLAKHCQVDGHTVRHLRLASHATGRLDVLIGSGRDAVWPASKTENHIDDRRWLTMTLREGLVALVLYQPATSELAVRQLVQSLIPAPTPTQA